MLVLEGDRCVDMLVLRGIRELDVMLPLYSLASDPPITPSSSSNEMQGAPALSPFDPAHSYSHACSQSYLSPYLPINFLASELWYAGSGGGTKIHAFSFPPPHQGC